MLDASMKAGSGSQGALPLLLVRRSDIELQLHRADEAAADAAQALKVAQAAAQPGSYSSTFGYAYLALGHALKAQGRAAEARAALRSAAEQLRSSLGPDHPDTRSTQQLAAGH